MTGPTARALILGSAFLAGVALCFGGILLVTHRNVTAVAGAGNPFQASIGGPFQLVDQNDRPTTDRDLLGHPFLVFFGFTHCPDVCPTTVFEISEVLNRLGPDADRVSALFVTVDPERDTPPTLKDYLSSFNPRLRGLTGDPAAIAATLKSYRVYSKKVPLDGGDYTMDHTAIVYLMDRDGRFVAPFNLKRKSEDLAADLRRYL
jgi:protein SCO1/2